MYDFENIWSTYNKNLFRYIKNRVLVSDAEDILQDVFIKINSSLKSLSDNQKIESWLYRITKNTIIDYYRKKKEYSPLPDWLENMSEEAGQNDNELLACLDPMIINLPEKYKRAIQISELDGKSQQELARIENNSLSGAKSRVQRGRQMLKEMFIECCKELDSKNKGFSCEDSHANCNFC